MRTFSFLQLAAVAASTSASQHPITVPGWAPRMGRLRSISLSAAQSNSTTVAITETGVGSFTGLASGACALNGDNQIALGDAVAGSSTITVSCDTFDEVSAPAAAFAGVSN
jgi:hypothetical protein